MNFSVGILVLSDKCSVDASADKTTGAIVEYFEKYNASTNGSKQYEVKCTSIVPDSMDKIKQTVIEWSEMGHGCDLILTSGGTGFTDNDFTPEAIKSILHREAPGIVHRMLSESFKITPFAMMARPVAGTRNNSLIITLPGSPKGALENLEAVIPTLGHALAQIGSKDSRALHKKMERTLDNAPPGNGDVVESMSLSESVQKSGHYGSKHDHSHHHHHDKARIGCGIARHELVSNDLSRPITERARSSPYPMTPMTEAFKKILQHTSKVTEVEIDIAKVNPLGYVFAEDIYSPINVPEFRASIVDGYAVKSSDGPGTYTVVSISHASPSDQQLHLKSGEISRVTTGAPIPLGADAVVMVEETQLISLKDDGQEEKEVLILASNVSEQDNVREVGSDIKKGILLFSNGAVITSSGGEVGILSSVGITKIKVYKKPLVGVLSTGDELVDTSSTKQTLQYGQIFDSNRPTLINAITNSGFQAVDLQIASDNKKSLVETIRDAFTDQKIDYLVTTGGVSMGELDLLKPIIERELDGTIHFGRVKMKPGKPTTFATFQDSNSVQKTVFALPGNPASAAVCFYLFVLPSLRLFAGHAVSSDNTKLPSLPTLKAKLQQDAKLDPRPEYQRVYVYQNSQSELIARVTGFQRSSRIASFKEANALVTLPSKEEYGSNMIKANTEVDIILFGQLGVDV